MSQDGVGCKDCKRVREHVASLLPFKVLEAMSDKPLRIRGVAMTAGISRNFNIYTPQELEAFSSKLTGAPVYIEHVSVDNAVGKVAKTDWDGHTLWYEAEIYESDVADKIRKGLVQHVSVGADYEAIDVVDGKIPHGLHNAELSLVAVPGIPQTNINILEHLTADGSQDKANEAVLESIAQKVTAKLSNFDFSLIESLKSELSLAKESQAQTQSQLESTRQSLTIAEGKLEAANKTLKELRNHPQSSGLLADTPAMMTVEEHKASLQRLILSPMVEHSRPGEERHHDLIRHEIRLAEERLENWRSTKTDSKSQV